MSVILYKGDNFTGDSTQIGSEVPSLKNKFNNKVSSIKVTEGTWILYSASGFKGKSFSIIEPGEYATAEAFGMSDNSLSSLRPLPVPSTNSIVIFESPDFKGDMVHLRGPQTRFSQLDFNDKASSAIVLSGTWRVYEDNNFGGRSFVLPPGRYAAAGGDNLTSSAQPVIPE